MTTSTATLVHTSSRALVNAERIARVAAAGRVAAERAAAERAAARRVAERAAGIAHNRTMAQAWVDQIAAAGAVEVGVKVCLEDGGKYRSVLTLGETALDLAHWIARGDDVEAWGIRSDGTNVADVLGVW